MANPQPSQQGHSIGEVLSEIGTSAKDLMQSEINLARAEIQDSTRRLGKHTAQAAIFGALLAISILPFLGFLVAGLGKLLGDNYWLSSFIVAMVCAVVGGFFTFRAYQKIKEEDLSLPRTRRGLELEKDTVAEKIEEVKETAAEKVSDIRHTKNRRAS